MYTREKLKYKLVEKNDMKNPQFLSGVSMKFDEYCSYCNKRSVKKVSDVMFLLMTFRDAASWNDTPRSLTWNGSTRNTTTTTASQQSWSGAKSILSG